MKIRLLVAFQTLACLIAGLTMITYSASADVTIDFRYGIQDGADCTNGVLLKIQIELKGEVEEIFAGEAVEIGAWTEPQSVEIPREYVGKDITLIWVIDPLNGNIGCDWFVLEDPWVVVNGAETYSFFDSYDDAEYTTVDVGGAVVSHGSGEKGRDAMWDDAGSLFVHLPWSKDHGFDIPDTVEDIPCERTIFCHPPQKGITNGGTEAVRFPLGSAQISVEPKGKLGTMWGEMKYR